MDEYSEKKDLSSAPHNNNGAHGKDGELSFARQLLFFIGGVSKKALKSYGLLTFGLFILGGFIYLLASGQGILKYRELELEKTKLEHEIESLQDENRNLRIRLERLRTDTGYLEDEARKKLGLVRPGETVFRLADEPDLLRENAGTPSLAGLDKLDINFSKTGDLFFNRELIAFSDLDGLLDKIPGKRGEILVTVVAEQSGGDERVLKTMEMLKRKGFRRIVSGSKPEP